MEMLDSSGRSKQSQRTPIHDALASDSSDPDPAPAPRSTKKNATLTDVERNSALGREVNNRHSLTFERLRHIRHSLIVPASTFQKRWSYLMALFIAYNCFFIPFRAGLDTETEWYYYIPDIIGDVIFIADIILSFYRAYYDEDGHIVTDLVAIRKRYLTSPWMPFDFLSAIPLDFIDLGNPWCRMNKLLRFPRLIYYANKWERWARNVNAIALRIIRLIVFLLFAVHYEGCFWFAISRSEGYGTSEWVAAADSATMSTSKKYVEALYFGFASTFGYYAPAPVKTVEKLYAIQVVVVGVAFLAFIIGQIGAYLAELNSARTQFEDRKNALQQYMRSKGIDREVQDQVHAYLYYQWGQSQGRDESELLECLPSTLRASIAFEQCVRTLEGTPFIARVMKDDKGFLKSLLLMLKPRVYTKGMTVIEVGEIGHELFLLAHGMFFFFVGNETTWNFLISGKVTVTLVNGKQFAMDEGTVFGELALLGIQKRTATITARTNVKVYVLDKASFDHLYEDYPAFAESVRVLAREHLKRDSSVVGEIAREYLEDEENEVSVHQAEELLHRLRKVIVKQRK